MSVAAVFGWVAAVVLLVSMGAWLMRVVATYRTAREEFTQLPALPDVATAELEAVGGREVTYAIPTGARQSAIYVPPRNGVLVLYVHGSPGSRASLWPEARELASDGHGALLIDLPGYGRSAGHPRWDDTFVAAIEAALAFALAQPEVDPGRIVGFGYSLGTSVLAQASAKTPEFRALVLLAPFTRLSEQRAYEFRSRWPGVARAGVWAAASAGVPVERLDTAAALADARVQAVMIIAGAEDAVIPPWMPQRLQQIVPETELWIVPGVGHVGIAKQLGPVYFDRLRAFLSRAVPRSQNALDE